MRRSDVAEYYVSETPYGTAVILLLSVLYSKTGSELELEIFDKIIPRLPRETTTHYYQQLVGQRAAAQRDSSCNSNNR